MKGLLLVCAMLVGTSVFAGTKTKTVNLEYEYNLDYKKLKVDVACVTSFDADEQGDGDVIEEDVLWFAAKDYKKTKKLIDAGYKPELNGNKGEQCDSIYSPGMGGTPHVAVYTYAYISNQDVKDALKAESKKFATREVVFVKSSFDKELLFENLSTSHDDIMSDIWAE